MLLLLICLMRLDSTSPSPSAVPQAPCHIGLNESSFCFACAHLQQQELMLPPCRRGLPLSLPHKRAPTAPWHHGIVESLALSGDIYNKFVCSYFCLPRSGGSSLPGRATCCRERGSMLPSLFAAIGHSHPQSHSQL